MTNDDFDWWIFDEATKDRKAVTREEYYAWIAAPKDGVWPCQMALDTVSTPSGKKLAVSSVFLTCDHGRNGCPVHFESMIFEVEEDGSWGRDLNCFRAIFYEELLGRHSQVVYDITQGTFQDYGGQTYS